MTTHNQDGKTEFRFYRPQATAASVAGDFNGWVESTLPMTRGDDGWWAVTIQIPDGEYRFRYVADGHWFTDFAAHGVEKTKSGWNSVLIVGKGASEIEIAA